MRDLTQGSPKEQHHMQKYTRSIYTYNVQRVFAAAGVLLRVCKGGAIIYDAHINARSRTA